MKGLFLAVASSGQKAPVLNPAAEVVFSLGPIPITNSMIATWVVAGLLFLFIRLGTRKLTLVPSGLQNLIEACVEGLEAMTKGLLEPKVANWAFPVVATFFIFILLCNMTDLLPGVGSIGWGVPDPSNPLPAALRETAVPLLRPPTSDANLTGGMALVFFLTNTWWTIRYQGPKGLLLHLFGPKGGLRGWIAIPLALIFVAVGFIEIISILIRPVALSVRLYGNIFAGEAVLDVMLGYLWGLPAVPFYFLEVLVAVAQAMVFSLLTIAFTATTCSHIEEAHPHK
ncbi:F0F1 ATP synthase subunit A [Candidatus Methylacidithermus pantelleriae]|uniref:ATP synthase subunit a n=1 Tax=Candidatus Methylacidithermus pantelleriae TaxID=2744239 RepID=A0A8J2FN61_9BACT|nr:F0F1 ATP synthase subunit A [Candidatus Methylacidithermus pantelleriae]CAF0689653.1 ATP synthase, F0 sector, subunit a [Candidatus Methylacidithermus pantelleriae]